MDPIASMVALATEPVQMLIKQVMLERKGVEFAAPAGWPVLERGKFPISDGRGGHVGNAYLELCVGGSAAAEKKDAPVHPKMKDLFSAAFKYSVHPLLAAAGINDLQPRDDDGLWLDDGTVREPLSVTRLRIVTEAL